MCKIYRKGMLVKKDSDKDKNRKKVRVQQEIMLKVAAWKAAYVCRNCEEHSG